MALVVFTIPFFSANVLAGRGPVVVGLSVVPILVLSVLTYARVPRLLARNPRNPGGWLLIAIPVLMAVAALFNPSPDGWSRVVLAAAASGLGFGIWGLERDDLERYVAIPLLAATTIQAGLAAFQLMTGESVVPAFIAHDVAPRVIDGVARPQGTMSHVYRLAAIGLLSLGLGAVALETTTKQRRSILAALAFASALTAMTFSRAALIGVVIVVGALVWGSVRVDRGLRIPTSVIASAFLFVVLVTIPSWTARVDHSMADNLDDASLGRMTLMAQSIELIQLEPLTGIGPGRYVKVLEERGMLDERYPYLVHNYPLAFSAENGVLAGILLVCLFVWLGLAAVRAGPAPVALFGGLLPLLMLDVLHYDSPSGQLMLGVWLGALAATSLRGNGYRTDALSHRRIDAGLLPGNGEI